MEVYYSNVLEVSRLLDIHRLVAGPGKGRKRGVEVLNKSCIVLIVACWESFIEDLASAAFERLINRAKTPDIIPNRVLSIASKPLKESEDDREVWKLAGPGWKDVIADHRNRVMDRYVGKLNTPKPKQTDALFDELIGLRGLSHSWKWPGASADGAKARLVKLVDLRGSIAHRVVAARTVTRRDVEEALGFVSRLAIASHERVNEFLTGVLGDEEVDEWASYIMTVRDNKIIMMSVQVRPEDNR